MGIAPNWTLDEIDYLERSWGEVSIRRISEHLNRSEQAVILKARKLGLKAFLDSGDYITLNQLSVALGCGTIDTYKQISWVRNRGLPIKYKRVRKCKFAVIKIEDFWKWAYDNQDIIDFAKFEPGTLGGEPQWAAEKRRYDSLKSIKVTKKPWTPVEDQSLELMLKRKLFTTDQIAEKLNRTEGAVIRRISALGLKTRPLRNSPHIPWTKKEYETLEAEMLQGANYTTLSAAIPRHSEKAIRGIVFRKYGTESLDKVRKILRSEKNG